MRQVTGCLPPPTRSRPTSTIRAAIITATLTVTVAGCQHSASKTVPPATVRTTSGEAASSPVALSPAPSSSGPPAGSYTYKVVATVPVPVPYGVAIDPMTHTVYVAGNGAVAVINEATNSVTATVPVATPGSASVLGVAVDPVTDTVYVPTYPNDGSSGSVSVVQGVTNTVSAVVPVGSVPYAAAVSRWLTPNSSSTASKTVTLMYQHLKL